MKSKSLPLSLCVLLLLCGVFTLTACSPPQARGGRFGRRPPEMQSARSPFMARFDRNHDGLVTRDEMLAVFRQMDTNADGAVDETEARSDSRRARKEG